MGFHTERERERDWLSNENLALVKGIKKNKKTKQKRKRIRKKAERL